MKLLILALSVVALRADSNATCLAGTGATLTDEECTARGIVDAATCDEETDGTVCAYVEAVCDDDDGNACTTNSATDGVCAVANVADETGCDDGDAGTDGDVCTSGVCAGTVPAPAPAHAGDATCTAGTGATLTDEQCTARGITDAATCDEETDGSVCAYQVAVCADDGNACTTTADASGVCTTTNVADETGCDDGDAGTDGDVCTSGVCAGTVPAPAPVSYGSDATCTAGSGATLTDQECTDRGIDDAATCDAETDGTVCVYQEASCTDTGNACTESVAAAGVCAAPTNVADETSCNDGDDATDGDVCTSGVCAGTVPAPAPEPAVEEPHVGDATCTAGTGATLTDAECTDRGIVDAATCDVETDGTVCAYVAAACADDGNACTTNTATDGVCATANVADTTSCDDGDDTTEEDVCTSGTCAGTAITEAPVPAPTSSDATCLAGTGATLTDAECTARTIVDAATCDVETDGTVCAYTAANCVDDGNDCTTASTATDGVCSTPVNVDDDTDCDDGDDSTTNDVCASGVCTGGDSEPTNPIGSEAGTPSPSQTEATSTASHAQVFAALASAFLLL